MPSMEQRIEAFDWASTAIGPRDAWPQSLRTALSICLASPFPVIIWWGPELTMLYNDACAAILGARYPHALGAPGREIWPELSPILGQVIDEGKGLLEESPSTFSHSPILDESGGVGGIFTIGFDTTTRLAGERPLDTAAENAGPELTIDGERDKLRNAQQALLESERKFSIAFDRSPLALVITSLQDGLMVDVNEGFVHMSGYTREEAIGRSPEDLGLWIEPEVRRERFRMLIAGEPVPDIEARFLVKNGVELIGYLGSAVVDINGRPCVLTSVVDITERKRAENTLRESEQRFREFANTAPAILWITDPDGYCTFLSLSWYELTGQNENEALGLGWTGAIHPDDADLACDTFLSANARHEPFAVDYRIRRADGEYVWVIDSARPRFSPSGDFLGFVGSVIDITERKHAEQAKDEFLATLSHELRTPLTSGFGWVKLLAKPRDAELIETGLRAIEESFLNQMKLIDDLLDISRIAAGKLHLEMQPLDLGSVVDGAVEMVRPSAEAKQIALRVHADSVLSVRGDASRLKQVFWNLLANAIKFTPGGGKVDVTLRAIDGSAEVVVRDNGHGIDAKFLPHVFARFRQADASTTRQYGGLGIGLSIVASLVAAHEGAVRAESDGPGRGSTFTVTLPRLEPRTIQRTSQPAPPPPHDPAKLTGMRIVIVDDDPGALQVMHSALAAAGAEVRECTTASEAFDAVTEWLPDLLISDLAMPNEDGYALLHRLRAAGHPLPALAITAYVRPEDEARVREAGFQRHVAKPFDPEDLVRAVAELRR